MPGGSRRGGGGGGAKELKPKNGILFYEKEVKTETAPEMTGRIHICCPECGATVIERLAGWWHKKGRNEYLKVSHSEFRKKEDNDDRGGRRGGGRNQRERDDYETGRPRDDRDAPAEPEDDLEW